MKKKAEEKATALARTYKVEKAPEQGGQTELVRIKLTPEGHLLKIHGKESGVYLGYCQPNGSFRCMIALHELATASGFTISSKALLEIAMACDLWAAQEHLSLAT